MRHVCRVAFFVNQLTFCKLPTVPIVRNSSILSTITVIVKHHQQFIPRGPLRLAGVLSAHNASPGTSERGKIPHHKTYLIAANDGRLI